MEPIDPKEAEPDRTESIMVEDLRQENEELRKELDHLLSTATNNERIWRHFTEIERILFRTRQLDVLAEELLREIKARFQPDYLVLVLTHADIVDRFFPELYGQTEPIAENTWIVPLAPGNGSVMCSAPCRPAFLRKEELPEALGMLPDEVLSAVQSGISIPLCIHEIEFGSLFLGSSDASRYQPDDGTDLLEQLGVKIALCMDNCLTYEKVKDFTVLDPVTGMMNYFQIHTILEKEFRRARRNQAALSILIVDLNFFHGDHGYHGLLTRVLEHVGNLLRDIIPEEEGYIGRYGSDEFLVVLPGVPEGEAQEVIPFLAQMIRKSPFKHQNTVILIQATIGVGTLSEYTKRPQDLLDAASLELCRLKMSKEEDVEDPVANC